MYAHVHMCMCTHVECACVSQFNRSIDMALIHAPLLIFSFKNEIAVYTYVHTCTYVSG